MITDQIGPGPRHLFLIAMFNTITQLHEGASNDAEMVRLVQLFEPLPVDASTQFERGPDYSQSVGCVLQQQLSDPLNKYDLAMNMIHQITTRPIQFHHACIERKPSAEDRNSSKFLHRLPFNLKTRSIILKS